MQDTIIFLCVILLCLLLSASLTYLYLRLRAQASSISRREVAEKYVPKESYAWIEQQHAQLQQTLAEKTERTIETERELAARQRDLQHLQEKLDTWEQRLQDMQQQAALQFENLAGKLFEEKSQKFTRENQRQLNDLLHPLREKIRHFSQDIEKRFTDEAKDVVSLKKEIEHLSTLNQQLSSDAQNLVMALKGNAKTQGDWGEMQLERLLEKAGLVKGVHFSAQASFTDQSGKAKRPDFIIHLPEGKNLVVDCKVSLVAYERYFNANTEEERKQHLHEHLNSLRSHVKDLAGKNYQHLYQVHCPDYVLLFVPLEPAFTLATQQDHNLFTDALDRNVVLVTTSTLLATMRTVSFIWQQEKQRNNVEEIARQSGALFDKFVGFVEDLKQIGQRMDQAHLAWEKAMNKLSDSKRYGETLIGRAEKIRELGAKTSKALPPDLIESAPEELP